MGGSNFLTIHQIPGEIINLIEESKEYCFLVTPYYKPWAILSRSLEKAALAEKKVIFVFRYNEVNKEVVAELNEYGFDIHFVERLHTKLYLNERNAIISSMNLFDSSKEFNYELGYKINSIGETRRLKEDIIEKDILGLAPKLSINGRYAKYVEDKENEKIMKVKLVETKKGEKEIDSREKISENTSTIKNSKIRKSENVGFCLRCKETIPLNPNAPYCYTCFQKWNLYGNVSFQEKYCHVCGTKYEATMEKPVCYDCYRNGY